MNREKETFNVWVSKYALTEGVIEVEVENTTSTQMVKNKVNWNLYYHKPYWHESKDEALKHAEKMRIKKLQSLERQIKKISSLKFD